MKLSQNDKRFTGVITGLIVFFSCLLVYYSSLRVERTLKTPPVGKIKFKNHVAMRKYGGRLVWEDVDNETPVYANDSILTGDLSDAELILGDDFRLAINANTLIVLTFQGDKLQLRLNSGSIQTSGSLRPNTSIVTKNGEKIDISRAKTQVAVTNKGTRVAVTEGEAAITTQSGKIAEVDEGSGIVVKEDKVEQAAFTIEGTLPKANVRFYSKSPLQPVKFAWRAQKAGKQQAFIFRLSQDATFGNGRVIQVQGESTTVTLGPGQWFWQVHLKDNRGVSSQPMSFKIFQAPEIKLYYPPQGMIITEKKQADNLQFRWSKPGDVKNLNFIIARDATFAQIVKKQKIFRNFTQVHNLKAGKYFWKLQANLTENNKGEKSSLSSKVHSFTIAIKRRLGPVSLLTANGIRFNYAKVLGQRAYLTWQGYAGSISYGLQVYRDSRGRALAYGTQTNGNRTAVSPRLKPGTYYYTVIAKLNSVQTSPRAPMRSFTIVRPPRVDLIEPLKGTKKGINPETRLVFLKFRWSATKANLVYRLQISYNRQFTRLLVNKIQPKNHFILPKVEKAGVYFWRVLTLNKNREILSKSKTESFTILQFLAKPGRLSPAGAMPVSLRAKNSLTFRWGRVVGANYYALRIYQKKADGGLDQILSKRISRNSYTYRNLPRFAEGKLFWQVSALNVQGEKLITQGQVAEANCTISYGAPPAKPQIIPDNPVIEVP